MNNSAATTYEAQKSSLSIRDAFARKLVLRMMRGLHYGQVTLRDGDDTYIFGKDESITVTITVNSPSFYTKILFGGSIGAGEAYIDHQWDADNLTNIMRIMVLNMDMLDNMERGLALLLQPFRIIGHALRSNTRRGSKKNIISHYDLSNEMYSSFLDDTMMYSSAIYPDDSSSLKEASLHKLQVICRKLQLSSKDHVVEIGTGWGGFAIYAAKNYGCRVTTTTISDAQYQEAQARVRREGLEDKIILLQKDYRELTGKFDKLVSIEMIEAVGHKYLPQFFQKCRELLKRNGMMLIQAITINDQKYDQYVRSVDFIQRHIFPGGCLPSNRRMLELIADKTDMVVRNIEDFGLDYARTLKDWRHRFNSSFPAIKSFGFDEKFRRLWEFYLCYCEGGFMERSISVVHLVATAPDNRDQIK